MITLMHNKLHMGMNKCNICNNQQYFVIGNDIDREREVELQFFNESSISGFELHKIVRII